MRTSAGFGQVAGSGWDVGGGVLCRASEDARWVTGIVLPIDAGATAISSTPSPVK